MNKKIIFISLVSLILSMNDKSKSEEKVKVEFIYNPECWADYCGINPDKPLNFSAISEDNFSEEPHNSDIDEESYGAWSNSQYNLLIEQPQKRNPKFKMKLKIKKKDKRLKTTKTNTAIIYKHNMDSNNDSPFKKPGQSEVKAIEKVRKYQNKLKKQQEER